MFQHTRKRNARTTPSQYVQYIERGCVKKEDVLKVRQSGSTRYVEIGDTTYIRYELKGSVVGRAN
jgi:hypothetical protein